MSAVLHTAVRRWWAGKSSVAGTTLMVLTAPLERAFRWAVRRRNRHYDRRGGVRIEGLRVVSVGNLVVGGTGKTPLAAWAARLFTDAGAATALVTHGYGRDELLLHRRWNPDVAMVADPDRVRAARLARSQGASVVVLDDGFQHRRLARDIDVVLLAAEDPYPGHMLPRGPYREPPSALDRAHAAVVTRRTASAESARGLVARVAAEHPHLAVGLVALLPGGWRDLSGKAATAPTGAVLCAAGVARPDAFSHQVAMATGGEVELLAFPDHHAYTESDARVIRGRANTRMVVVTEKDSVKLRPFEALLAPIRVMVQSLRWEEGEEPLRSVLTSVVPKES